jgi:outer membrane lipoprotein LolB
VKVWLAILLALLAGTACAPLASLPPPPERPAIERLTRFAFSGRLSVRQGDTRHHVRIDWRHDTIRDDILLSTPFGQGVAEIVRDAAGARLILADQRTFVAADAASLSEQVFGLRLPLDDAMRWLLGHPGADASWRVTVIERESAVAHSMALPSVLELTRDDIEVHLKIDDWSEAQ